MSEHRVRVENGKYELILSDGWKLDILRGNEPWVENITASKCLHGVMCELDAARVVLGAARALAKCMETMPMELAKQLAKYDDVVGLVRALTRHSGLVDDNEPPSVWAKP